MDEELSKASRNHCAPPYRNINEMKVGFPFEPWHSTPAKKHTDKANVARQTARSPQTSCYHVSSLSLIERSKITACEMEILTIQKQRLELQLLIAELKDRDQELNSMTAAYHRQRQAWEQDRQRVLTLELKCARLEDELQKRNEVIRAICKRLKVVEAQEKDRHRELSYTQQCLQELSQRQQHSSQHQQDLQEKNRSMNSTIMTLSSQVGQLRVHEEELGSMLKLKDKDLMEATNHILGLTNQLRESCATLKESQARESKILNEMEEYKHRFREARYDITRLKDELREQRIENNSQREELIRLKQENQLLRKELALADEGVGRKDDLLSLARSKQERTESELLCLRQVCANQQNDLQLLNLNLETTREALRQSDGQRSLKSDSTAESDPSQGAGCKAASEMDIVAVINHDAETPVLLVDVNPPSQYSCPGSVTCLYMDCSTPSPWRWSPGPTEEAQFNNFANGKHEECVSSTSRLQRLLTESKQMVANLEHTSGNPLSTASSPTPKSDCGCSLRE